MVHKSDTPYDILRLLWPKAPSVEGILQEIEQAIVFSDDNAIHVRGFFAELAAVAQAFDDSRFWLLDLDGQNERWLELRSSDTEDDYVQRLAEAPEWGPGLPFSYAVRYQVMLGRAGWILISDRDGERMHLIMRPPISRSQLDAALAMFRPLET